MKCVIAFSCLLAVASAGFINNGLGLASPLAYTTSYAAPLAYAAPRSFGYQSTSIHPVGYTGYSGYASPLAYGYSGLALASEARQVDPVAIAAGAPLPTGDTVEVAAAKAAHLQAHAVAKGRALNSIISPAISYSGYGGYSGLGLGLGLVSEPRLVDPVAIAAGAPLPTGDTVEVAAAKALHYQAHAVAKGRAYNSIISPAISYSGYSGLGLGLVSEPRLVDPVAIAAGAPLPTGDTVEVAAAKALHYQAHVNAKSGRFLGLY